MTSLPNQDPAKADSAAVMDRQYVFDVAQVTDFAGMVASDFDLMSR
jgi:hypothetical protein